jgi:hypothetical protein
MSKTSDNHEKYVATRINAALKSHKCLLTGKWKASRPPVDTKYADVRIDGPGGGIWVEVKMGQNDFLMNPRFGYQERGGKPVKQGKSDAFPFFNGWYVAYDMNDAENEFQNSNSTKACKLLLEEISKDRNIKLWIGNFKEWLKHGGKNRASRQAYWKKQMHGYFHMSSMGGAQRKSENGMVNVQDMKGFVFDLTRLSDEEGGRRWRKVLKEDTVMGGQIYHEPKNVNGNLNFAKQNLCAVKINVPNLVGTHYAFKADGGAYYMQAGHDFYLMKAMGRSKGDDPLGLNEKLPRGLPRIPFFGCAKPISEVTVRLSNRSSFHEFMTEIKMNNWTDSKYSVIPCKGKINPFTGETWTKTVRIKQPKKK